MIHPLLNLFYIYLLETKYLGLRFLVESGFLKEITM